MTTMENKMERKLLCSEEKIHLKQSQKTNDRPGKKYIL